MHFFTTKSTTSTSTSATPSATDTMGKDTKPAYTEKNSNTTSPATPEPGVLKAVRQFEHGRQRAKKSANTENWKAGKAMKRQLKAQRAQHPYQDPPATATRRTGKGGVKPQPLDLGDERVLDESTSESDDAFDIEVVETPKWREDKLEVDLTKLIRPAKARRSKGMFVTFEYCGAQFDQELDGILAGDFELIPSVRSVLVLEDKDFAGAGPEDDEPWEYLSASGDDPEHKAPSYAEVAASR